MGAEPPKEASPKRRDGEAPPCRTRRVSPLEDSRARLRVLMTQARWTPGFGCPTGDGAANACDAILPPARAERTGFHPQPPHGRQAGATERVAGGTTTRGAMTSPTKSIAGQPLEGPAKGRITHGALCILPCPWHIHSQRSHGAGHAAEASHNVGWVGGENCGRGSNTECA